jgi:hypothetical protein
MNKGKFILLISMWASCFNASSFRNNINDNFSLNGIAASSEIYYKLNIEDLSFDAFNCALTGYLKLKNSSKLKNDSILTIIDYSLPSTKERLFIIDLKNYKLITKSLVAHGKSTGMLYPESFSNNLQSYQSSLGFFITENTYEGKHGYSLRINGIEKNINDNALKRAIVFHSADYVSKNFINQYGRIGRSFGCPALPVEQNRKIIDLIKNNTCVFIYFPAREYISKTNLAIPDHFSQIILQ